MLRRPPRSTRTDPLFPYTTLFRSGKALCLDYDFNGVSGYVGIQRDLPINYPENYAFAFEIRGDSPANDLEMKFIDASGDNVWWVKKTGYEFPVQWTPVRYKKRHIVKDRKSVV